MTDGLKGNPHAHYAESHADTLEDWMGSDGVTVNIRFCGVHQSCVREPLS